MVVMIFADGAYDFILIMFQVVFVIHL